MVSRRRFTRRGTILLLLVVVLLAGVALVLVGRPVVVSLVANGTVRSLNGPQAFSASGDPEMAELSDLGVSRQIRVETEPGPISLRAWVMEPEGTPRATVVVAHGIHDGMRAQVGTGRMLADAGCRVVLVDLRGHGRSGGEWLSYGVHEAVDLVVLLDELEERGLVTGDVGAVGTSYGGAVVIEWAAVDDRVRNVVAISTFASLREIVPGYVRLKVPVLWRLVPGSWIDEGLDEAGRMAGFDPDDARPVDAIGETDARVLLVHGTADENIPLEHAERMHEAAGDRSRLVKVEGVDHYSVPLGTDEELNGIVVDWLLAHR